MQKIIQSILVISVLFSSLTTAYSLEDRYKLVIEESFYVVKPENSEKFLEVNREKLYPFWSEMQKREIIVGEYKLYSQRLHTLEPHWTYKTVVVFKNYEAVDQWLELRDEVYNGL
ncbi:MAG: hypothetical protein O6830_02755, partial [Candidatus Dadabacteria bacterium]|nr:hypothetical protein [Candidatus Dadabacteria bacterium]